MTEQRAQRREDVLWFGWLDMLVVGVPVVVVPAAAAAEVVCPASC
jgi:hypothetical protein